jgi:hypothetical protein
MASALRRHEEILGAAVVAAEGQIVKTTGDGLMAVFASPVGAIAAGVAAQLGMIGEAWPEGCSIRVRVGLHTGEAEIRGGDYFGPAVNRTARIMAAGHGGQILVSASAAGLAADRLPAEVTLRDLGEHRLKDLERPERMFQVLHPGLGADFPPLLTLDLRPNNLPTQTSPFIGRELGLESIRSRIADDGVRMLTLTGPGGTGKTPSISSTMASSSSTFRRRQTPTQWSPSWPARSVLVRRETRRRSTSSSADSGRNACWSSSTTSNRWPWQVRRSSNSCRMRPD